MITQINLTNFKCISDFEMKFSGGIYLITGENKKGKSTILEAIITLLTGDRGDTLLQIGKDKGTAGMDYTHTDGKVYRIEVNFTTKNPRGTFRIIQAETGIQTDRITALQSIFNYTDFDVSEFISWSSTAEGRRKQLKLAQRLLPTPMLEKIAQLEQQVVVLTKERTEANSKNSWATGKLKAIPTQSEEDIEKYSEPVVFDDLMSEIAKKREYNKKRENAVLEVERLQQVAGEIFLKIKELQEVIAANVITQKALEDKLAINPKPYDIEELEGRLKSAGEHNQSVLRVKEYLQATEDVMATEKEAIDKDAELDKVKFEREQLIKANPFPIPGLEYSDEGLIYNGLAVAPGVLSTSEEMELAARLVMALNPHTKIFRVAQGESLGTKMLADLAHFALENGYQGFIEQVVRDQEELHIEQYEEVDLKADSAPKSKTVTIPPVKENPAPKAKKTGNTTEIPNFE